MSLNEISLPPGGFPLPEDAESTITQSTPQLLQETVLTTEPAEEEEDPDTQSFKDGQSNISDAPTGADLDAETAPSQHYKYEDDLSFVLTADALPTRKNLYSSINADLSGSPPPTGIASLLLEARQADITIKFGSKDQAHQNAINSGSASIKKTFNDIKATIGHMPPELLGGEPLDWDFWSKVVDDYDLVVQEDPESLQSAVADGIPKEFRGIIWQLVARSKDLQLEELYMHLKGESSIHERAIKRDLTRTSFFTNVEALKKGDELYNVIKAYSLFDPDVGYTQGMVFIAVPLILNMTEAECFCLLVALMKEYGLRELFAPDMHGLHLLLHQFDRLLDQNLPLLYNHLIRQGVRSLMYASQWFLTFFSYKFPLDVVLRIFDLVITQGMEGVLRLAVNLMIRNEATLLRLNFDSLLDYLKANLFNVYVSEDFIASPEKENRRFSLLPRKSAPKTENYYKLNAFILDSLQVPILPTDLMKFKLEFDQMCTTDAARVEEIEKFQTDNGVLRHEIKELESEYFKLHHDHIRVVQLLVDTKVILPEVLGDIEELKDTVANLQGDITELESKLETGPEGLPQDIDSKIQELLAENANETERFANLEEQLNQLTLEYENLSAELKQRGGKKWFW